MIRKYQEKRKGGEINSVLPLLVVFFPILLLVIPCVSTAGGLYINEFGDSQHGDCRCGGQCRGQ